MRRSHSSSSIPIPRNLVGQREAAIHKPSIQRSRSTNRSSYRDSTSSLKRNPSLERKSTIPRLSKLTPVGTSSRAISTQRGTQLFSSGQRLTNVGPSPRQIQENRTIQKLSTDKRWVAEQFIKVQEFVTMCSFFDSSIVNANNLKPPSIKAFVHITGVLLQQCFPNLVINVTNYKEVIAEKLKLMRYPGTLPNSIMKTVNTMHSWPQVIGMLSWLVDKVNVAFGSSDVSLSCMDPEEKQSCMKMEACCDLFFKRYSLFNDSAASSNQISQVNNSYVQTLISILDVDPVEYIKLKTEMGEIINCKENQEKEIQKLITVNKEMKVSMDNLKKEINTINEQDHVKCLVMEDTICKLTSKKKKLVEERSAIKVEINSLQETLKTQPCTYECKKELLSKIEELKTEINAKREKTQFKQDIKREFDEKLDQETLKIQEMVIEWNRRLVPLAIKEPRLKALELRETAFHRSEFLTELVELQNRQAAIKSEIGRELECVEIEFEKLLDQHATATLKKMELEGVAEKMNEKCQVMAESTVALKAEKIQLMQWWEKEQNELIMEQEGLQRSSVFKVLNEEISCEKMKCQLSEQDLAKYSEKIVVFFVELNRQVKNTIVTMNEIMNQIENKLENTVLSVRDKYTNILNKFNELEQLKIMLEEKNQQFMKLFNEREV